MLYPLSYGGGWIIYLLFAPLRSYFSLHYTSFTPVPQPRPSCQKLLRREDRPRARARQLRCKARNKSTSAPCKGNESTPAKPIRFILILALYPSHRKIAQVIGQNLVTLGSGSM